jgi:hypothetical protein
MTRWSSRLVVGSGFVLEWARLLGVRGGQTAALEALAPYVATGWWKATEATAELLEDRGRADEAIALVRPNAKVQVGDRLAETSHRSTAAIGWLTYWPGTNESSHYGPTRRWRATGTPRGVSRNCWRNAATWRARSRCISNRRTRRPASAARYSSLGCWPGPAVARKRSRVYSRSWISAAARTGWSSCVCALYADQGRAREGLALVAAWSIAEVRPGAVPRRPLPSSNSTPPPTGESLPGTSLRSAVSRTPWRFFSRARPGQTRNE